MDKLIIFGAGTFYSNNKELLKCEKNIEIVAFMDNNDQLWGKRMDGIPIYPPQEAIEMEHDYIIIMAAKITEMREQLRFLGAEDRKILFFEKYMALRNCGRMEIFLTGNYSFRKKKALVAVPELGYTGVPILALYAALAIKNMGYEVFLAASAGDDRYIGQARELGISVLLVRDLFLPNESTVEALSEFSYILVNSIGLENLVVKLSKYQKIFWWLHNAKKVYGEAFDKYGRIEERELQNVSTLAVSRIAAENFCKYFPNTKVKILCGGIPDRVARKEKIQSNDKKIVFAMIGYTSWIKAQDIFIDAVERMPMHLKDKAEFWMIGRWGNGKYEEMLDHKLKQNAEIEKKGELKGQEMSEAYDSIDVVVNCSRDETLSLTVIEGMMHERVCIASEAAGIADYIEPEKNALLCQENDCEDLCKKMCWIIEHRDFLWEIGKKARKTYEDKFSMKAFEEQLIYLMEEM